MRLTERRLDGAHFERRAASEDTKREIADWEVWDCADPTFSFDYVDTVTMFVQQGAAVLTFGNGETVDLAPGDLLTVKAGASADWVISAAIRNSFRTHDAPGPTG